MTAALACNGYFIVAVTVDIEVSLIHYVLKSVGQSLFAIFLFGNACACHHAVAVAYDYAQFAGLVQSLRVLTCKRGQLTDRGVLLKNNLSVAVGKYFKRITLTDNIDTVKSLLSGHFRYSKTP